MERPIFDPNRIAVPAEPLPTARQVTVSQLNTMIKGVLAERLPGTLHVVGEISNLSRPASGHVYLTLKDKFSEIRATMWRSEAARLKFQPADGMQVIATGRVDVYEPRGQYQFHVQKMEPRGAGALDLAFRQLHDKLRSEGLFEASRKKKIPQYPCRIAVVTSPTGAAVRDILTTLRRRFPCVNVMVHPVRVQGEGAAALIAEAITRLNQQAGRLGGIDVMIVARGGGSLEDLWAFNEEIVARAIAASRIPVICGVGHEVDLTIADLVADLRAPTPTAAAELAVPVQEEVLSRLAEKLTRIARLTRHAIDLSRSRLAVVQRAGLLRDPAGIVHIREQRLDELWGRLRAATERRIGRAGSDMHHCRVRMARAQPLAVIRQARHGLHTLEQRLHRAGERRLHREAARLAMVHREVTAVSPVQRVRLESQRLTQLGRTLIFAVAHKMELADQSVKGLSARVQSSSHKKTLERGYTITYSKRGKRIITNPQQVAEGDRIITETAEGTFESRVVDAHQGELFE